MRTAERLLLVGKKKKRKKRPSRLPVAKCRAPLLALLVLYFAFFRGRVDDDDFDDFDGTTVRRLAENIQSDAKTALLLPPPLSSSSSPRVVESLASSKDALRKEDEEKIRRPHPGEAREVCASWSANPNAPKMTVRKSYWLQTQGILTANELKRKSSCAKGGGSTQSCWQRKLTDLERIRNVGSPSLARLMNETVVAMYRASEDVVGAEGQHLRMTVSRAGEGKGWRVSAPFEEVGKFHNNDWKRGSGMPMWDPIVFVERDGKGRAFVFYAVSDSTRRCLLYTSPSPRDGLLSRMPSSA